MSELAQQLKTERFSRGLTTKAVSEKANISLSVVEAIEEGEFEKIGAAILIRSFVRNYCAAVGIDPQPILDAHAAEISGYDRQTAGIKQYGAWSKSVYGKKRIGIFPTLMMIIALAGALYGGMWLWKAQKSALSLPMIKTGIFPQQELPSDLPEEAAGKTESSKQRDAETGAGQPLGSKAAPEVSEPRSAVNQGAPTPESGAFAPRPGDILPVEPSQASQKHRFEIETTRKIRVKVIVDMKDAQSLVLKPGEKRSWDVLETMQIEMKNLQGVRLKWDGRPLSLSGKPGQAQRLTLPAADTPQSPKTP